MTRCLLTGAAGFIGHHTVEHLLINTDWDLVLLDSLNYAGDTTRLEDVNGFEPDRVSIHWHDLRAPIGDLLRKRIGYCDYVINMASESHVDRSIEDPVPFVSNNVALALTMLEYARDVGPKKFIQVSTDEVYGPAPHGYSHKEWDVLIPSNPYSASKAAQEAIAIAYWRTYGVPVAITNTMNNFGARQHPEKFIPMATKLVLEGKPVPIHARWDGDSGFWEAGSRVWLHARNHADALLYILEKVELNVFPVHDRPTRYHVAGEKEIANDVIVAMIGHYLDKKVELRYEDFHRSRPGHDLRYSLDGSALRDQGWRAPVDFEESFEATVRWYAEQ